MEQRVSCEVIGDLLPLVEEQIASAESAALVEEHLTDCAVCREKREALRQTTVPETDGEGALRAVKKELRRRRWRTAALAALLVFVPLLAILAYSTAKFPVPFEEGLVTVESEKNGVLTLSVDGRVSGMESTLVQEPDSGEKTLLLQAWTSRSSESGTLAQERGSYTIDPVPDRVLYGYGFPDDEQKLIFGEPMNGGILLLPRLVLAYYALIALAAALVFGLLWLLLRKKKSAGALRALFFAAAAYPIGHLLIKGLQSSSFFILRDLAFILVETAAVFGLLTILWRLWQQARAAREA